MQTVYLILRPSQRVLLLLGEIAMPASYDNEGSADKCLTPRSAGHHQPFNRTLTAELRGLHLSRDPFGRLSDCTREYRGGRDLSLDRVRESYKSERFCCV